MAPSPILALQNIRLTLGSTQLLEAAELSVVPGDLLILLTDGVRHGFERDLARGNPVDALARTILASYRRGTDDALVLVARVILQQPA